MSVKSHLRRCAVAVTSFIALSTTIQLNAGDAKYIFYFIGDGMGIGHAASTERYLKDIKGVDAPLMMSFPIGGMITTYSASQPVTDSAAAGTALSTGSKTRNGMLGMNADTVAVNSIALDLQKAGYGIGIITNVCPDDATPGAFYAHVPSRKMYYEIGCQAAQSGYQFIAGSNWRGTVDKEGKPTDLMQRFAEAGYTTLRGDDGFENITAEKIVMLNTDSLRIYDLGQAIDSLGGMTLPRMTTACLSQLERVSPDRFFMMVEGGNIDWAGHANDGATIVKEVINFNEALEIAYKFYQKHPEETLIVVTADHETGGMALGNNYHYYNADLKLIDHQKMSKDAFNDEVEAMLRSRRIYTWDDMKEILTEKFGLWTAIKPNEKQEAAIHSAFDDTFGTGTGERTATYYKSYSPFVMELFKVLNDIYGFGFTTGNHSGNMVPVYAIGADSNLFSGFYDNTAVPRKILEASAK